MTAAREDFYDAIDGTWAPARRFESGPWTLREGQGGGSRVSAATLTDPHSRPSEADIGDAVAEMRALDQEPLFMVRDVDHPGLDAGLGKRGFSVFDPVAMYGGPVDRLTDTQVPPVTAFTIWPPLEIMKEIWADGDIGPARLAVMDRAAGEKTAVFGRTGDKPAGVAYVALHGPIAMLHALEVAPQHRRDGLARWMLRRAAFWAADHGATHIAALCRRDNFAACALYNQLGMEIYGQYHYRRPPATPS
ncbi:GNAT family N-acetyltransferase [Chachezhania antarctica]|uniref:GNAT family N-acetyltransferase n=1 Tax=Chachezhania antarctica TaxID=2340860 RepID=UPI000EB31384|nr:GNAT family N-acetyltransferase [Chachezhania antarctica]|tara:strand:+ start:1242 stop:1985 length:744 start_codon:yes stop_codon:yes gene_type:complete